MPRCAVRHVKLVAEAELPILPFLAPRVFQPWPVSSARSSAPSHRKAFSSTSCERARQTRAAKPKFESARSLLVQQWYESAIAPLEPHDDTVKDEVEKKEVSEEAAKPKRSVRRDQVRKTHFQRWSTSQSLVKSRWTASKRDTAARTKWAALGRPVRRKATDDPDAAKEEVAFSVDGHFLYWNHHFARLNARYDARLNHTFAPSTSPNLNFRARKWATQILNAKEIRDFDDLGRLLGQDWRRKWIHALLWTLANSIDDAARFLEKTHVSPYLPAAYVSDAIDYIAQHYSRHAISDEARQHLVHVLCAIMERPGTSPLRFTGGTLRRLLQICTEEHALRLIESTIGTALHWNTRLHIATYLAHHNRFDQALDALLDAVSDGADVKSQQFESNCATILRKAAAQPDGLRVSLRLVQNLSEIGVQLNVQLCNIVMLNAVEAGDLKTAFTIYHSLVDNNLVADEYTHAILLKGCKNVIDDSETLNSTIRHAIADVEVLKLRVVASEIIHCLCLHHSRKDPENAFSIVSEAFAQLFDTSELVRLGILPERFENRSSERMQPTLPVLGVMISAYLRHVTQLRSRNTTHVYDIYRHWRGLSEHGIRPFVDLARDDFVANAFLLAFIQDPAGLAYAAEVVRDMQTPFPSPKDAEPGTPPPFARRKPSVQTWSIFLHGFAKHGKMDVAEQVLSYMREQNMEPNRVTWNSLLGGYARVGRFNEAVETFVRMRDEGLEADEVTQRHLGKIKLDDVSPGVWNSRRVKQSNEQERQETTTQGRTTGTHDGGEEGERHSLADDSNGLVGGMSVMSI